MRLFLGVDGGQSGTTALIGNEHGDVLGRGNAGPCNHVSGAEAKGKFTRAMEKCVGEAAAAAGLNLPLKFEAACVGMSGGAEDKEALLRETIQSDRWVVTNDAAIALAGAFAGAPGVIVIAGTGSMALGRGRDGEVRRAGGWGYVFGDEGGAFDIVRQGLRACLRAEEGWGQGTRLTEMLLQETGCADVNAVLHLFYTAEWPRSRVAALAPSVDRLASEGDPVAVQILSGAAQGLALFAQSVRRQLWDNDEVVDCSYVGGVFRSGSVLERYRSLMELSGCRVIAPLLGPAEGALVEAYRLAGLEHSVHKLLSSEIPK